MRCDRSDHRTVRKSVLDVIERHVTPKENPVVKAFQPIVVGRHCESGDQLVDGVALREPSIGDLLAVPVTGAYCYTMSNQYNGARRVPVVFTRAGAARLVVRRDTWDDLLMRDVD